MTEILVQDNYKVALDLARETFLRQDPARQAQRCGGRLTKSPEEKIIEIQYLDHTCLVSHPEGSVNVREGEDLSEYEQILVLHYIISTQPAPPEGEPIAFSQVPSGAFYDSAFQGRVKNHFLSEFAGRPELLPAAAEKLGGEKYEETGDMAVRIPAFPRVSLYFVLWKADEEFPADMNLLLGSNIASYLSTEDIAVLGGIATGRLIKHAKALDV